LSQIVVTGRESFPYFWNQLRNAACDVSVVHLGKSGSQVFDAESAGVQIIPNSSSEKVGLFCVSFLVAGVSFDWKPIPQAKPSLLQVMAMMSFVLDRVQNLKESATSIVHWM
jgi:hypothetical protein